MTGRPKVAVLLDENTSTGGTRYEAAKGYFAGLARAGGLPLGMPYETDMVDPVVAEFDALLTVGGRYAMPAEWYMGEPAPSPRNDRLDVEIGLLRGFLAADKPVLGICAGMQVMAALHGAKLTAHVPGHNDRALSHHVRVEPGSKLATLIGERLSVNTFHNEAIVDPGDCTVTAWADDGTAEAIELPGRRFALGVQWHQELFAFDEHPGNGLFRGLVDAARTR